MSNFVSDGTWGTYVPYPKTNLYPIPAAADPTKYVDASKDWNTVCQALEDVRSVLRYAKWYGLSTQAGDPTPPAGLGSATTPPVNYIYLDTAERLWLRRAAGPVQMLSAKDAYTTAQAAGVALTQRTAMNFSSRFSVVDNAGQLRTDVELATTGVSIGTYTLPTITVDTYGRITAASNGPGAQSGVYAGPAGSSGAPSFRSLVASDLPGMVGATSVVAGAAGIVPAPTAGQQSLFLRGDGTWAAAGGGTTTLAAAYANGGAGPQIFALDATRLGVVVRDASTTIGQTLLGVQNNAGTIKYFDVTTSGIAAPALDATTAAALSIGATTATGVNLGRSGQSNAVSGATTITDSSSALTISNAAGTKLQYSSSVYILQSGGGNNFNGDIVPVNGNSTAAGSSTSPLRNTWSKYYATTSQTPTFSPTMNIDPSQGEAIDVTLTASLGAWTASAPAGRGARMILTLIQSGTGGFTIGTPPASLIWLPSTYLGARPGTTPTLSTATGKKDTFFFQSFDGVNWTEVDGRWLNHT